MFLLFSEKRWEKLGICSTDTYILIVTTFWIGGEVGHTLFLDRKYTCLCYVDKECKLPSCLILKMYTIVYND